MARNAEDILKQIETRLTGNEPQVSAVIKSLGDIRDYFREERTVLDVPKLRTEEKPYTKREYKDIDKVVELDVGAYDPVRVLRHALQQAEKGKIDDVIIICCKHPTEGDGSELWACWSDMVKLEVLWLQRWFNSWLNKRYFGDFHSDD